MYWVVIVIDIEYMECYFKLDTYRAKQLGIGVKLAIYDPIILLPPNNNPNPNPDPNPKTYPTMISTFLCDVIE